MHRNHQLAASIRLLLALILALGSLGLFPVSPVIASTLTVTTHSDSGNGSLRQAIANAVPGDTIVFDAILSGKTIVLQSPLVITKNLTIDGSATTPISISGNDKVRIFTIEPGATVVLKGLTIRNGYSTAYGGGIYNRGNLTVLNSTLLKNHAAEYGLGGGIFSMFGTLTVKESAFIGNVATEGGGINNNNSNTANLANVTFFENSASIGGGINNHGVLNLSNVTVSHNFSSGYGGLYNAGTLNYVNTILANSAGHDCYTDSFGTIGTNKNNWVESFPASSNDCGTPSFTGDPQLGPMAFNGGMTRSMALLPHSPAIDAGDDSVCETTDQRGVTRPKGDHCDLGAYESPKTPTISILNIHSYGWPYISDPPSQNGKQPVHGQALNLTPGTNSNYYVTCYIFVPDYPDLIGEYGWWIKPGYSIRKTPIDINGDWSCLTATGGVDEYATKYRAYLFPATLIEPPASPPTECSLPDCVEVRRDDLAPPETTIMNCPEAFTTSREAVFYSYSSHTENLFHCTMDGIGSACTGTFENLTVGEHIFTVYAEDVVKNIDPTPASCRWKIYIPSTVYSISRTAPNPITTEIASFTVVFSETVSGVDEGDFILSTAGSVNARVEQVSGSGAIYTVTVELAPGKGSLRLDLIDDDSIKNADNLPLGGDGPVNGNFTDGEVYFVNWDPNTRSAVLPTIHVRTQTGSTSGSAASIGTLDQSGLDDDPSTYIRFETPGKNHLGYLFYSLPSGVKPSSVMSMKLLVNLKGPGSSTQLWTWHVYDRTRRKWIRIGDTTGVKAGEWQLLTFSLSNPVRFLSSGLEICIRLTSSNASDDMKIDYSVIQLTYRVR